jgi:hypothetical protein
MNKFDELIQRQIAKRSKNLIIKDGVHTIGEFINAVFSVKTEQDAKLFYDGYLLYLDKHQCDEDNPRHLTVEQVAQSNIGWCFGEGMKPEYIRMWSKVCKASHPVFGNMGVR